ncbi:MAG: NADH-quinone oxidoreductase subunit D, partial [Gemmataceae bacterium]
MALEALETSAQGDQEYLWTLNFGPQHPATHTTLRLILTLDGETVVKAVPDIGYLHSGFEKLGEHLDFNQYVTIVDRMNYISPVANEIAWHHTVEKLLGIELTPRCKYLRVIFNELMRIHDHLLCVGAAALDLGAFTAFLYGFYQRELINDMCESAAGQRFHPSYTRVGGLMYDVTDDFIRKVRDFVKNFPKTVADICRLLNRNRIFVDRTKGVGVLSKEDAINLSATGPIARASGVVRDLRKDEPYLAYKDFDFKVVCATGGDCFSRYLVRMDEMVESLRIIDQAIENLPAGPVDVDTDSKMVIPDKHECYRTIEGLIQHFELHMWNRRWEPPVDEIYGAIESPNGELGFYIVSDGTGV